MVLDIMDRSAASSVTYNIVLTKFSFIMPNYTKHRFRLDKGAVGRRPQITGHPCQTAPSLRSAPGDNAQV